MIPSPAPTVPWAWAVRRKPHLLATPLGRSCPYRASAMMATNLEAYNKAQLIHSVALGQESRHCPAPRLQSECRWPGLSVELQRQNPSRHTQVVGRIQFQAAVSLRSPLPCWLSPGGRSLLLGATATHVSSRGCCPSICRQASNL